jgi:hypothetical protein
MKPSDILGNDFSLAGKKVHIAKTTKQCRG